MKIEVEKRLRDALTACDKLADRSSGRDYEWYRATEVYRLACARLLKIVGEALKAALDLPRDLVYDIPETCSIIGLRNRVIHEYDAVDDLILWTTIEFNIPELTARLSGLLGKTQPNDSIQSKHQGTDSRPAPSYHLSNLPFLRAGKRKSYNQEG